jgi:hypothetical protein
MEKNTRSFLVILVTISSFLMGTFFRLPLSDAEQQPHKAIKEKGKSSDKTAVKIVCDEMYSNVYIDGKKVGSCPYQGVVAPGTRNVLVEAPGKKSLEFEVKALAGITTISRVELSAIDEEPVIEKKSEFESPGPLQTPEEEQDQEPVPFRQALAEIERTAKDPRYSIKERIEKIDIFLGTYSMSASTRRKVTAWRTALQNGHEPETIDDPEYIRTRTEAFSFRYYFGNYGSGLLIETPTGRWPWFYFGGRIGGGGGAPAEKYNDRRGWVAIGMNFGVPFSIGKKNLHEIRIGTGVLFGFMKNYIDQDESEDRYSVGPIVAPEIIYVFHIAERFALQFGCDAYFPLLVGSSNSFQNGYQDDQRAIPMFNGFIGFRI